MNNYWGKIKNSYYWNKMKILRENENNRKSIFISQEIPNFFVNKNNYDLKISSNYSFSENELKQISIFYKRNYKIENDNAIFVEFETLKNFLNLNSEIVVIYKEERIIGMMISILIPFNVNTDLSKDVLIPSSERFKLYTDEKNMLGACSSFLVIDRKYRKKGFGMSLIQESLQILHKIGGISAYFLNTVSRCKNSIKVNVWRFPLDLNKLDKCKFNYPKNYKSLFQIKTSEENIEIVDEKNLQIAYNFYINYIKNKKINFLPNLDYWAKWIKVFPTYIIQGKEIKGIFSFYSNIINYPKYNENINTGYLLFCLGENTLKNSLNAAKKLFDILIFYETGDININEIKKIFAQKIEERFINFYNINLFLNPGEFYCPIF